MMAYFPFNVVFDVARFEFALRIIALFTIALINVALC